MSTPSSRAKATQSLCKVAPGGAQLSSNQFADINNAPPSSPSADADWSHTNTTAPSPGAFKHAAPTLQRLNPEPRKLLTR